jgi:hypothetical protein
MKKSIKAATAAMLLCAMLAGASEAAIAGKTRTKSNNSNDRAAENPTTPLPDAAKQCAAGKHFTTVNITARHKDAICVANVSTTDIVSCTTQTNDWSFESRTGDAIAGTADAKSSSTNSHVTLCDALQKATMAINANPETLAAIQAKVNVQDLHFVYDMLVSNGVPAEILGDPNDEAANAKFGWDIKENKVARTTPGSPPTNLQLHVDWDQKTNIKVLM